MRMIYSALLFLFLITYSILDHLERSYDQVMVRERNGHTWLYTSTEIRKAEK